MVQGNALGLGFADVCGAGSAASAGRAAPLVLGVIVIAENGAVRGQDLIVVLLAVSPELHIIDPAPIVPVLLGIDVAGAALGDAGVTEGNALGLGFADVCCAASIGAAESGGAVPFSLSVPAQNVAGFGVDLIVILLAGGVELHLIDAHAIVPVGLYNEVQGVLSGNTGICQGDLLGLLLADDILPAISGVIVCRIPFQLGIELEHPARSGVNGVVIFGAAGIEFHLIFLASVVVVRLGNEEDSVALGNTGMAQGSFLGLFDTDVGGGGSGSGNRQSGDEQGSGNGTGQGLGHGHFLLVFQ